MPQVLILGIVVLLIVSGYIAVRWIIYRDQNIATNAEVSWKSAGKVEELIILYLDVLLVHGPDSTEAKSFRFGVDNDELWKGNDSLNVFKRMIGLCDSAVRRHKTWKNK